MLNKILMLMGLRSRCCGKPIASWDDNNHFCDERQGGCGNRI